MLKGLLENIIKYLGIQKTENVDESVNAEKGTVVLDDLTQYTTNEAITYMDMKNLNYQIVGEGSVVTSSAPHAGTEVEEGSTIIMYVTKGENDDNMTQTPSVLGLTYDEAVQEIMNSGLSAVVEGDEKGVVVNQNPKKGEYVVKGSDVTLTFEVKEGSAETQTQSTEQNGESQPTEAAATPSTKNVIHTTKSKTGKVFS